MCTDTRGILRKVFVDVSGSWWSETKRLIRVTREPWTTPDRGSGDTSPTSEGHDGHTQGVRPPSGDGNV